MKWIDKKLIGKQYPDISFAIEKQRLRFFQKQHLRQIQFILMKNLPNKKVILQLLRHQHF